MLFQMIPYVLRSTLLLINPRWSEYPSDLKGEPLVFECYGILDPRYSEVTSARIDGYNGAVTCQLPLCHDDCDDEWVASVLKSRRG